MTDRFSFSLHPPGPPRPDYSKRHDVPPRRPRPYPRLLSPSTFSNTSSHAEEQPSPTAQQGSLPSPSPSDIPSQAPSDRQSLSLPDHPPAYQNVDDPRAIPAPSTPPRSPRPLPPVPSKPPTMINQGNGFNHHQPPSDQTPNPDPIAPHSREVSASSSHAHQDPHSASPSSVLPFARPYSTPTAGTPPIVPQGRFHPPSSTTTRYDRSSTASLPPASQTPFYTLPAVRSTPEGVVDTAPAAESSSAPWTQDPAIHQPPISSQQEQLFSSAASTISYAPPPPPYTPSLGAPLMGASASEYSPAPLAERMLSPPPSNPSRHIPPPAPPTILAPPPSGNQRSSAPHEPFLAHAPPPPDSWIAVETMPREYTLVVRLPGFGRDGMYVTVLSGLLGVGSLPVLFVLSAQNTGDAKETHTASRGGLVGTGWRCASFFARGLRCADCALASWLRGFARSHSTAQVTSKDESRSATTPIWRRFVPSLTASCSG